MQNTTRHKMAPNSHLLRSPAPTAVVSNIRVSAWHNELRRVRHLFSQSWIFIIFSPNYNQLVFRIWAIHTFCLTFKTIKAKKAYIVKWEVKTSKGLFANHSFTNSSTTIILVMKFPKEWNKVEYQNFLRSMKIFKGSFSTFSNELVKFPL